MTSDVQAFALTIHTGTDAFKPDPSLELARILREVADQIEAGCDYGKSVRSATSTATTSAVSCWLMSLRSAKPSGHRRRPTR